MYLYPQAYTKRAKRTKESQGEPREPVIDFAVNSNSNVDININASNANTADTMRHVKLKLQAGVGVKIGVLM